MSYYDMALMSEAIGGDCGGLGWLSPPPNGDAPALTFFPTNNVLQCAS